MLDKLEAVNRCLQAIGEARVNSLQSGAPDAAEAETVLDEVRDEVLMVGWFENTRYDVEVTPDLVTNEITVPTTWHSVDAINHDPNKKIVVKTDANDGVRKLFEVNKQTFQFDQKINVNVITSLEFDDLSFPLKNYISARAARVFQERLMGSVSLDSFTGRAEAQAWSRLMDAEIEIEEPNMLTDSPYMREITGRNNRLTWR
jgi:hypothetical protein